jgi:hypothetical protein
MVKPKRARGSEREKKRKSQATKARRKTIRERVMVLGLEWSRVGCWQRRLRWGDREIWVLSLRTEERERKEKIREKIRKIKRRERKKIMWLAWNF